MTEIRILTEEESSAVLIKASIANIQKAVGKPFTIRTVVHKGKSNLLKDFATKIEAVPPSHGIRYMILCDQDSEPCEGLKERILRKIPQINARQFVIVRIVCQELEAWYLGDEQALKRAYSRTTFHKKNFQCDVDQKENPKKILSDNIGASFISTQAPEKMAKHMDWNNNKSRSCCHFIDGIKKLLKQR